MGRHESDKSRRRHRRHEEGEDLRSDEEGSRQDRGRRDKKGHDRGGDEGERKRDREDGDDTRDRRRHKKHRRRDDDQDDDALDRDNRKRSSRKHRRKEESDEEDRKHKKSRKHHKKDHRDQDDELRSRKKDKKKKKEKSDRKSSDKRTFISLGPPLGKPPDKLLDGDADYFAYHEHLWVYVYREHGRAFNDMTSEESRDAFRDFTKRYNKGELAEGYYVEKLPAVVLEESKTTKHSWSFRMSETEGRSLQSIEAGVRKQTEYRDPNAEAVPEKRASAQKEEKSDNRSRTDPARDCVANRRLKEHVQAAEEEFGGGRKEGRERQIEKRKETGARIHGAARDRESAAGVPEIGDAVLYGGDDRKQFAREKERSARRQESRDERLTELQAKEKGRQEAMLKQLGLSNIKPGQKITIQPRKDA